METTINYVPYQLCPKCQGDGQVMVQQWNQSPTSITNGPTTCDVCNGAKIIAMHPINIPTINYGADSIRLTDEEIKSLLDVDK